jgi:FMN-dependent NADH-azoreductase
MAELLLVNSSPRRDRSESVELAEALIAAYRAVAPAAEVDRIDLFGEPLPLFGPTAVEAKMRVVGGESLAGVDAVWQELTSVFDRFAAADIIVFTVPMWNAGIPWVLKHLIDLVTQPGLAFSFDPEAGYTGLLAGKRAVCIYTSRVYRPGVDHRFGVDFHSTYFEYWLSSIGIVDIDTVRFQPTYATPDFDHRRAAALARARGLGRELALARVAGAS